MATPQGIPRPAGEPSPVGSPPRFARGPPSAMRALGMTLRKADDHAWICRVNLWEGEGGEGDDAREALGAGLF